MFQEKPNRQLLINGMNGTIKGDYLLNTIYVKIHDQQEDCIDVKVNTNSGHKGADGQFIDELFDTYLENKDEHLLYNESIDCLTACFKLNNIMNVK
jgi:hypothetical protein